VHHAPADEERDVDAPAMLDSRDFNSSRAAVPGA
jgi:hypothetical protein